MEGWAEVDGPVPEELEAATHAAMAAYTTFQAKLKALKQARGYFKRTEPAAQPDRQAHLKKLMAKNPCCACGQLGHWSKDPGRPRNAKGATPEGDHAAMSAAL